MHKTIVKQIKTSPARVIIWIPEAVGNQAVENLKGKKTKQILISNELPVSVIEDALGSATNQINGDWYNNEGGQGTITINTKTLKMVIDAEFNIITQENETQEVQL